MNEIVVLTVCALIYLKYIVMVSFNRWAERRYIKIINLMVNSFKMYLHKCPI